MMGTRNMARQPLVHHENATGKQAVNAKGQREQILKRAVFGEIKNRNTNNRLDVPTKGAAMTKQYADSYKERVLRPSRARAQLVEEQPKEVESACALGPEIPPFDSELDQLSTAFSSQLIDVEDIDSEDSENPQLVSNYVQDIYKYLWHLETHNAVSQNFLDGQKLSSKMRGVLVDWLVQVHLKFNLLQETLYMTVALMDRYLQADRSVTKEQLQLVGVSCMFIATKFEEMYLPELEDFAYITARAFTCRDIRQMEIKIMSVLKFNLAFPLSIHFLRRNSKASRVDGKQHTLAKYLLELTLAEYSFCWYKPSHIAAAASYLSLILTEDADGWTETAQFHSRYSEEEILPLACRMACLVIKRTSTTKTVRDKYSQAKFMKISESDETNPSNKVLRALAVKASSSKASE